MYKQLKDFTYYIIINKMSKSEQTSEVQMSAGARVQGRVKWFNNKSGYGFVTLSESNGSTDVFVHHSALAVGEEQYKYLVQGEYVEFELARVTGGTHEWQASDVRGLHNGKLMCETRHEARVARVSHAAQQPSTQTTAPVVQSRPVNGGGRGSGGRGTGGRGGGRGAAGGRGNWVLVRNKTDTRQAENDDTQVRTPPRRRPQLAKQDSSQ